MAYSGEKAYMKEIRSHFWALVVPSSLYHIDPFSLLYAISYYQPELVMVTTTYQRKGNSACCNLPEKGERILNAVQHHSIWLWVVACPWLRFLTSTILPWIVFVFVLYLYLLYLCCLCVVACLWLLFLLWFLASTTLTHGCICICPCICICLSQTWTWSVLHLKSSNLVFTCQSLFWKEASQELRMLSRSL